MHNPFKAWGWNKPLFANQTPAQRIRQLSDDVIRLSGENVRLRREVEALKAERAPFNEEQFRQACRDGEIT